MHLTNFAINKHSENYMKNTTVDEDNVGHKRSLAYTLKYIEDQGFNSEKVMSDINETIVKSLITVQP